MHSLFQNRKRAVRHNEALPDGLRIEPEPYTGRTSCNARRTPDSRPFCIHLRPSSSSGKIKFAHKNPLNYFFMSMLYHTKSIVYKPEMQSPPNIVRLGFAPKTRQKITNFDPLSAPF
jgi:hypothetical protein